MLYNYGLRLLMYAVQLWITIIDVQFHGLRSLMYDHELRVSEITSFRNEEKGNKGITFYQ